MPDMTNVQFLTTGVLTDAETAMHAVGELLPKARHYVQTDRAEAYEEVVDKLAQTVDGLTVLLRQITDGLVTPDVEWAAID